MNKPIFTIITCTYNSEKYILKNIYSVEKQVFKDFEHVFIDGYSKDKTKDLILNYQKRKNNVKFVQTDPKGISNAMNIGIKNSLGKYILFLHSDDSLYDSKVLKDVFDYFEQNGFVDWIYGKINVYLNGKKFIGTFPSKKIYKILPGWILKYFNYIPHQAVIINKKVFNKFGFFDENIKSAMDIDLWLRIYNKTKWNFIDRVISNYSVRKDAQSSGLINKKENDANILKVEKRYLNSIELLFFMLVKKITDYYNKIRC